MRLPIYQVDAFTDCLFGGNPAAIVPLETWLPDELLQEIASENNLSETAYFVRLKEGFHLRWFTPACEVDLCGHATLATAHVLWRHLRYDGNTVRFCSRSGWLGVGREADFYVLDFPTDELEKVRTPGIVAQALECTPAETLKGREDYLVILKNESMVENLAPDYKLLATLKTRGIIATAPGVEVDFVSRCFYPSFGINEDPVTGSAHTTLTPYWAGRLGKTELTARQISRRGGFLKCRLSGDRTFIMGKAVTYLIGQIEVGGSSK
jgi:predicted PhzF superfamily epimerase YddE/YHI9